MFNSNREESEIPSTPRWTPAQRTLALLIVAYAAGAVGYKWLFGNGLGHTALTFIGLPALLAIILALAPRPQTATGSILRGIAIALLLLAPLLGEGYLCILFASPLFLAIGLIVGAIIDRMRERRRTTLSCIALALLPLALEGVVPALTHQRTQSVAMTDIVAASSADVASALAQSPQLCTPLPRFLRIGFPRPLTATGSGLAPGDERTIHFSGAEGDPPGDLTLRVTASQPGFVRFETMRDTSKLKQWLRWRSSEISYSPVNDTHTRVTWRITFDRSLDPWWYFAPWEHYAVREAAQYLLHANAIPPLRNCQPPGTRSGR
jgi:hypothetical protein